MRSHPELVIICDCATKDALVCKQNPDCRPSYCKMSRFDQPPVLIRELPKEMDSKEAHKHLLNLIPLFYEAQDAHERHLQRRAERNSDGSAVASDKARGKFFIAVCEWAKTKGAVLTEIES